MLTIIYSYIIISLHHMFNYQRIRKLSHLSYILIWQEDVFQNGFRFCLNISNFTTIVYEEFGENIHFAKWQLSNSAKFIRDSFKTERNMIVATVVLLIVKQTYVRLVHNQKENCHYDRMYVYSFRF